MNSRNMWFIFFLAAAGIALGVWSLYEPLSPPPKPDMFTTHEQLEAIGKAQKRAQEIAASGCQTVRGSRSAGLNDLEITFKCGDVEETMKVGIQHRQYSEWLRLFRVPEGSLVPGTVVRFVYSARSLNEASDAMAENDKRPEYYLTPVH